MDRKDTKVLKHIKAMSAGKQSVFIQAMADEGVNFPAAIHSLLDGSSISSISGTTNEYKSYTKQVTHTYKKYNGEDDYGNNVVRTIVDIRAAFEAGEGVTIVPGEKATDQFKDFVSNFLTVNKLQGTKLFDLAKTTEMCGYVIPFIKPSDRTDLIPKFCIVGSNKGKDYYFPVLHHSYDLDSVKELHKKTKDDSERVDIHNFVFIRTGGDGSSCVDLTTKVGISLTDCEAYDKALKQMRELNWKMARLTAAFETENATETDRVYDWLQATKWGIGDAFVGTAKLSFKSPGTGALDNLSTEMTGAAKTISGNTSIPVHWLGHTDLMSNRSTAEELYDLINNGTIVERTALAEGIKQLLIIAQEVYIDSGGELAAVYTDFDVNIPIISFNKFKIMVEAYSKLYADDIVSKKTYRGIVPNIDAMKEEEQIEAEKGDTEEEAEKLEGLVTKTDFNTQILGEENNDQEGE